MANNDFDWKAEDVRVLRSYGDAIVYPNEYGDIAIRQADYMGGEDVVEIVPRQQATWLLAAVEEALRESASADVLPGKGKQQS
jgi:hypothetical protein